MEVQQDASSILFSAYRQGKWSDLTIINKDKEYRVHKLILSASIPYFEKTFLSGLSISTSEIIKLDHPVEVFDLIIDWVYCQRILITKENAVDLFNLANYMKIPKLTGECLDFFWNYISDSPLLDINHWIKTIATNEIRKIIDIYICLNFVDIVHTYSFLDYDSDTVAYMIDFNELKIANEIQVFEAIMRWVEADEKNKSTYLPSLLAKVRWRDIDGGQLRSKISKFPWIKKYKVAKSIIMDALELSIHNSSGQQNYEKLNLTSRINTSLVYYKFGNISDGIEIFTIPDICSQSTPKLIKLFINENLPAGKFHDLDVTDHKIENHKGVIRIDWRTKTCRLLSGPGSWYDLMFGRLFHFNFENRRVYSWKGDRSNELAQIPYWAISSSEVRSGSTVSRYGGSFYVTAVILDGSEKKRETFEYNHGYSLRVAKFIPSTNNWQNKAEYKIFTKSLVEVVHSKALVNSIEIYVNHLLAVTYDIALNTFSETSSTEEMTFERRFYRFQPDQTC